MAFLVDSLVPSLVRTLVIFVVLHPWSGKTMSKRFRARGDWRCQGCVVSSSRSSEENVLFLCLHRTVSNSFPSFWSSESWGFCQTTLHFAMEALLYELIISFFTFWTEPNKNDTDSASNVAPVTRFFIVVFSGSNGFPLSEM